MSDLQYATVAQELAESIGCLYQHVIEVAGRVFRYDDGGFYDELIRVHHDQCEPSEMDPYPFKVEKYLALYQAGSDFPPIDVCGTTPIHPLYRIVNGHHRYQAAKRLGVTLRAWSCSYKPFVGYGGEVFYTLAKMSETDDGRQLAGLLGKSWCPRCFGMLNYRVGMMVCLSCECTPENMKLFKELNHAKD